MNSTPPERLVSSFSFVTADASRDLGVGKASADLNGGIGVWEGRVVFADSSFAHESSSNVPSNPSASPLKTPSKASTAGTAASPITIHSSPSSPSTPPIQLTRPRAIPQYTTSAARTAFTPPRLAIHPTKPVHPFFARTKSLPPPPSQRPRMVAEYYSTDETASQSTCQSMSQDSPAKWRVGDREIELITHEIEKLGMGEEVGFERVNDSGGSDDAGPSRLSQAGTTGIPPRKPMSKPLKSRSTPIPARSRQPTTNARAPKPQIRNLSTTVPSAKSLAPSYIAKPDFKTFVNPKAQSPSPSNLPLFSYKTFRPNPPKIAYTTSPAEANDLLSCLEGPILGFDMEWPIAGWKAVIDPVTGLKSKKLVGGTVGPDGVVVWGQCKTALIQVCDKRLVVLIHVCGMEELPSKLVEILQDPKLFKAGVAIKGDAQKLRRDYPTAFPEGISSLLELSHLARRADPVNTGPGGVLISLANLTKEYLGRELDKEAKVRKGDWMDALNRRQIDYAANDVVVAVHLHDALIKVADEQGIVLRQGDYVSDVGRPHTPYRSPKAPFGGTNARSTPGPGDYASDIGLSDAPGEGNNTPRRSTSPEGVTPARMRAVERFIEGLTCAQIAEEREIKVNTVRAYISQAMEKLPLETMTVEQQVRFLADASEDPFVRRSRGIQRVRKNLGQNSDSEDE